MTPAQAHWTRPVSLLAIDPGASTGWALFIEAGGWHLSACGVAKPDDHAWTPLAPSKIDRVVIENPQIYPNSKARPADVITLARVVGRYEERFSEAKSVTLVTPHQWKGSVDGDVFTKRIEGALTPQEATILSMRRYTHDTLDAIGLGKWALKQLKIMRAA